MSEVRLRVNAPQVIYETIDGEVIIINLGTGSYYSVKGSGAAVWDVVQRSPGTTAEDVVESVANAFAQSPAQIAHELQAFLDQLRTEELLVEAAPDTSSLVTAAVDPGLSPIAYEAPMLEKYTDMQDLVLLDPVHEVDAAGWPQPRPETPAPGPAA